MGTLYVVATPIGNLQEMSPRAIETLRSVDLIAAEDTRHTATLLRAFDIGTPTLSYHQHNERAREDRLLSALEAGSVALVSDAGTPAIADPGNALVAAARAAGHRVVPIAGPSAVAAAVSASGLVPGPYLFLGFVERQGDTRRVQLGKAAATGYPVVLFESPVRLGETLADLREVFGERDAVVARELTKLHEEIAGGTLSALVERFGEGAARGEIVIVIGGETQAAEPSLDPERVVRALLAQGMKPSRAARETAAITGLSGADAYDLVRRIGSEQRA
ncbi:MAG TPA: 16S rRNA (cytidine(1402)-2'-O)-methyltransferase [Thermomicrobiales bacterium]|nr:16S rRNA (cytidine(1402)-2'-O)-methyltransferase [Thermomicrobiales bacterium]